MHTETTPIAIITVKEPSAEFRRKISSITLNSTLTGLVSMKRQFIETYFDKKALRVNSFWTKSESSKSSLLQTAFISPAGNLGIIYLRFSGRHPAVQKSTIFAKSSLILLTKLLTVSFSWLTRKPKESACRCAMKKLS